MSQTQNYPLGQRTSNASPFPLDGSTFAMDSYLMALQKSNVEWYRMYDLHIRYFTSLHKVMGDKDIERIWPVFMRQLVEFGKVAVGKKNGKFVVLAITDIKHTIDYKVKWVKGIPARLGYGINEDSKSIKLKGDDVVVCKYNFNAFPFVYYWKDALNTMIDLKDAAITASIASIKKFKRNMMNNSSEIAQVELMSMTDPRSPFIDVVASPVSYFTENEQRMSGNQSSADKMQSTVANSVTFESSVESAKGQFENLQAFMEYEYFLNGRRINTNKKTERNISKEIDTETINFDVLEQDANNYINKAVEEMVEKFGIEIEVKDIITEKEEVAAEEQGDNNTEKEEKKGWFNKNG